MLSRFLERARHFTSYLSHSALTRLVHDQIMTSSLGPNFDQGLTAGLSFRICNRVLRAFHRLVIQLGYHIPTSQSGLIRRANRALPAR